MVMTCMGLLLLRKQLESVNKACLLARSTDCKCVHVFYIFLGASRAIHKGKNSFDGMMTNLSSSRKVRKGNDGDSEI